LKPENIKDIEEARLWAVEHETRIDILWENQLAANKKNAADHVLIIERLERLEKRVLVLVVIGTLVGSMLGNLPAAWLVR